MAVDEQEVKLIASQLKKFRVSKGLSQQAIGDVLHVSNQQYSKFETAANRISASQLLMIASAFEVPIERFFINSDFD